MTHQTLALDGVTVKRWDDLPQAQIVGTPWNGSAFEDLRNVGTCYALLHILFHHPPRAVLERVGLGAPSFVAMTPASVTARGAGPAMLSCVTAMCQIRSRRGYVVSALRPQIKSHVRRYRGVFAKTCPGLVTDYRQDAIAVGADVEMLAAMARVDDFRQCGSVLGDMSCSFAFATGGIGGPPSGLLHAVAQCYLLPRYFSWDKTQTIATVCDGERAMYSVTSVASDTVLGLVALFPKAEMSEHLACIPGFPGQSPDWREEEDFTIPPTPSRARAAGGGGR